MPSQRTKTKIKGHVKQIFDTLSEHCFNLRTYNQSHTPTVVQGRGVDGTPPWVFVMSQYFEKISPLIESLCFALQDEVHIMVCRAAGGPVTSFKIAAILGAILDFTKN